MNAKPIVIAAGDPTGIGPEITIRAVAAELAAQPDRRFVVVGDCAQLGAWSSSLAAGSDKNSPWSRLLSPPAFTFFDPTSEPLPFGTPQGHPSAGQAALAYLRWAAEGCLRGDFAALVTAPLCKEAVVRAGIPFVGQTEFLADLTRTPEVTMMLLGDDDRGRWLRVALVTTHLPLRQVPDAIQPAAVERAIRQSHAACRALGLPTARIAVCGLNPHAGEGGVLGDEEGRLIRPAIDAARAQGIDVHGPASADTLFHQAHQGRFDAVVAMYHDQGLGPLKLVAFERGVNWTLGLPFPRTSPDHGTAYDIAGQGIADPSSMRAALRLAAQLAG